MKYLTFTLYDAKSQVRPPATTYLWNVNLSKDNTT